MSDLVQLLFWIVWGAGTPLVYGLLLRKRRRHYQRHHDRRALRDAMEALGLFLVSIAASLGITVALLGPSGGIGRILFAISCGAFFAVGVYALAESQPDDTVNARATRQ